MNSKALFTEIRQAIVTNDGPEEKDTMAFMLLESLAITRENVIAGHNANISEQSLDNLRRSVERLNAHEPIQYVLGASAFYGRIYRVNTSVLIPRPETEELVRHVVTACKNKTDLHVVDLGTGSGCLAITLALELTGSSVDATDISIEALALAQSNAKRLRAPVRFHHLDMLTDAAPFRDVDVIISNPPYITPDERPSIHERVKNFEPSLALFTDTSDPLQFYRAIATQGIQMMKPRGLFAVEVNEKHGHAVKELFQSKGFKEVELLRDLSGKDRIVTGTYP